MFELRFHPAVKKDLKKIEKSVADEIRGSHFVKIKKNPFVAENLLHVFKGLKSYHFKSGNTEYRIIYEVYKDENIILVLLIGNREHLYEKLRRRRRRR
ncbi:MAG: type II toxin-antitoxin system mRNA interferase toxin, RelE/StbE family [Methanophagales archaeon]|nr:type II toxin-antitoxin system mRNA interferase toxin, RelE/StbE family [Methanophagales archaeon]